MMRVTEVRGDDTVAQLRVEGHITQQTVAELSAASEARLNGQRSLLLDVSGVRFVDAAGADLLRTLAPKGMVLIGCSGFLTELLHPNGSDQSPLTDESSREARLVDGPTYASVINDTLGCWDLPDSNNRVTLTESGAIMLSYTPNNEEAHKRLQGVFKNMLKEIGCHDHLVPLQAYIPGRIPLAGVAHQNGTCRFGRDPKTSVLDVNCKAHDLDNLYVVDGAFFPSSGAVNPALTIMANALRVGDHLLSRMQ